MVFHSRKTCLYCIQDISHRTFHRMPKGKKTADFCVTGFDNFDKASYYRPRITTVSYEREKSLLWLTGIFWYRYIKLRVDKTATYSFQLNSKKVTETFPESQTDRNDILSQAKSVSLGQKIYGMIGNEDKQDFYVFDMPFSGNLVVSHTNYIESGQADYEILK